MNIKPNLHNFVMITGLAILGLLLFKLASRTGLARVPLIGQAIAVGASA